MMGITYTIDSIDATANARTGKGTLTANGGTAETDGSIPEVDSYTGGDAPITDSRTKGGCNKNRRRHNKGQSQKEREAQHKQMEALLSRPSVAPGNVTATYPAPIIPSFTETSILAPRYGKTTVPGSTPLRRPVPFPRRSCSPSLLTKQTTDSSTNYSAHCLSGRSCPLNSALSL